VKRHPRILRAGTYTKTGLLRVEDSAGKLYSILDVSGDRFGRLLVLRFVDVTDTNKALFLCTCDCGKQLELTGNALRTENTKSCGCFNREAVAARSHEHSGTKQWGFRDLTGVKQGDGGRLTALRCVDFDEKWRYAKWECICDCGKVVIVPRGSFLSGHSRSCGCLKAELARERWAGTENPNVRRRVGQGKAARERQQQQLASVCEGRAQHHA